LQAKLSEIKEQCLSGTVAVRVDGRYMLILFEVLLKEIKNVNLNKNILRWERQMSGLRRPV
jgi:hypothetical protein